MSSYPGISHQFLFNLEISQDMSGLVGHMSGFPGISRKKSGYGKVSLFPTDELVSCCHRVTPQRST